MTEKGFILLAVLPVLILGVYLALWPEHFAAWWVRAGRSKYHRLNAWVQRQEPMVRLQARLIGIVILIVWGAILVWLLPR